MKRLLKLKWLVLLVWLAGVTLLFSSSPDMGELVRAKGQITVPDGYSSSIAADILAEVQRAKGSGDDSPLSAVLVFHQDKGLTDQHLQEIQDALDRLEQKKEALGVTELISPLDQKELKEELLSPDQSTMLVPVTLEQNGRSIKDISTSIYDTLQSLQVPHYLTGSAFIGEDLVASAQNGLKKTELITIAFILVVMLAVFRSPVAPLIPLVTIGITYLAAQSIVAFLVNLFDFPLSNFTQIFLVAVLFGIGTDYCILLLSRFKEELASREDRIQAVLTTYATAGKTVWFSGLAVLVGFATVGFSTFALYRSAVAVAVGIAVLLVALSTLVPVFMALLGPSLFWPAKGRLEHRHSTLWTKAGRFTLARPLVSLFIVALITVPVLYTYQGTLSFDPTEEIGDSYPSVQGFKLISTHFEPGEALPAKVVLKDEAAQSISEQTYLALVEKISRQLEQVDGVAQVRSATRPTGEPVDEFMVSTQAGQLNDGLTDGREGIEEIRSGLEEARHELSSKAPELEEATAGIVQLVDGTAAIKEGIDGLSQGLSRLTQGIEEGAKGAGEIKQGLQTMQNQAQVLQKGTEKLFNAYHTVHNGLLQLSPQFKQLEEGLQTLIDQLGILSASLAQVEGRYPVLAEDGEYQRAKQLAQALALEGEKLVQGLSQLNSALAQTEQGLKQANSGFSSAVNGQKALIAGMDELIDGLDQLEAGLNQGAQGQNQVLAQLPELTNGLTAIHSGQEELMTGFGQLGEQLDQLTQGLKKSSDGLHQVADGLSQAGDYLDQLTSPLDQELDGWYLPEEALDDESFQLALDTYTFDRGTVAVFEVVLEDNPYALSSLAKVDELEEAVHKAIQGTPLEEAEVAVDGASSAYADLLAISSEDYARTAVLMLVGITLILIIVLRSLTMPIYLLVSLVLTYYTSMAVCELIFVDLLGFSGINWAVSFFAFVMLISLGIDYSIFLMHRFNEYKGQPIQEAILESMGKMGTVILSAAMILGGTFAAMYPSGVVPLAQIATIVLTGLILYAVVVLPLFVPVMVKLFGDFNWWPFTHKGQSTDPTHPNSLNP